MIGDYTFVVTNLRTNKIIDEVDIQSFRWTVMLNRPGSARFTARLTAPKTTPENFLAWDNGLWVLRGNDIEWGGYLGAVQPRAGTGIIEGPVYGFPEYMRHRLIIDTTNMTNATVGGLLDNDIIWEDKNDLDIAIDLINHSQRGNHMNLTPEVAVASTSISDLLIHKWDYKYCGEVFEQFAARENGFGWWTEYYYDANNLDPRAKIMLTFPRRGRTTDFRFTFDQVASVPNNIKEVDADGGKIPLTGRLGVIGSGEGDAMIRSDIENTDVSLAIDYDDVVTYKDVILKATLTEKGNFVKAQRQSGKGRSFTMTMDWNMMPQYSEYVPGDEVNVFIDNGWFQVDSLCTVTAKEIILNDVADPDVKVTAQEIAFSASGAG